MPDVLEKDNVVSTRHGRNRHSVLPMMESLFGKARGRKTNHFAHKNKFENTHKMLKAGKRCLNNIPCPPPLLFPPPLAGKPGGRTTGEVEHEGVSLGRKHYIETKKPKKR